VTEFFCDPLRYIDDCFKVLFSSSAFRFLCVFFVFFFVFWSVLVFCFSQPFRTIVEDITSRWPCFSLSAPSRSNRIAFFSPLHRQTLNRRLRVNHFPSHLPVFPHAPFAPYRERQRCGDYDFQDSSSSPRSCRNHHAKSTPILLDDKLSLTAISVHLMRISSAARPAT